MSKKRGQNRPRGHYCKICGEYKANEKFSGKGYSTHICKACACLSAADKAEAMTINRLLHFPDRRLSESEKKWLENRVHDQRPEVAELAKKIYDMHFPHAARNTLKKQLTINTLLYEVHGIIAGENSDLQPVSKQFSAERKNGVLTMTNFRANGMRQSVTLDSNKMTKLLRWVVSSLEVFAWPQEFGLTDNADFNLDSDMLPIFPDETNNDAHDWEDENPSGYDEPEGKLIWRIQIKYSNRMEQDTSYYDYEYIEFQPKELYLKLLTFFEHDEPDVFQM